jgi:hypothetical protein
VAKGSDRSRFDALHGRHSKFGIAAKSRKLTTEGPAPAHNRVSYRRRFPAVSAGSTTTLLCALAGMSRQHCVHCCLQSVRVGCDDFPQDGMAATADHYPRAS